MEEKKEIKIRLSSVIYILIIICLILGIGLLYYQNKQKDQEYKQKLEEIEKSITDLNQNKIDVNTVEKTDKTEEKETQLISNTKDDQEKYLKKIYCITYLPEFKNVTELSLQECSDAVYIGLNGGYIGDYNKDKYTTDELVKYVQYLFGRKIQDFQATEGFKEVGNMYELQRADGESLPKIKNATFTNEEGKMLVKYNLYKEDVSGNETLEGKFLVTLEKDSESGNVYIASKSKI